jgi:hypothetical protein
VENPYRKKKNIESDEWQTALVGAQAADLAAALGACEAFCEASAECTACRYSAP